RLKQDRQQQLLKEKTTIEKSLDLIVYPILTLPVELTSEIFLHCLPAEPVQRSLWVAPMLLGRICRRWREIAYDDPRLWAALGIILSGSRRRDPQLKDILQDWVLRAGSVPLTLSLYLPY
ncbi:hypothetical protein DFH06DRAFT_966108, partial [Mycena polygramma]